MKRVRYLVFLPFLAPLPCAGADREILELQRQVALLDDRVNTLQRSLDEKIGGVTAILKLTLDKVTESTTQEALNHQKLEQKLVQQAESSAPSLANLNAVLDRMSSELVAISSSMGALGRRLNHLETKVVDLDAVIRALQVPPSSPSVAETQNQLPPGTSAEELYQSAVKDQLAGRDDLALQEFTDYLKYFGNTGFAAEAQLHVAEIHYYGGRSEAALDAFQLFLDRYPDSPKAPDALFMVARVLKKQGKKASAVETLKRLVRLYPNSGPAGLAQAELQRVQATSAAARP